MQLKEYIFRNFDKKQDFAKQQGVEPCVVSQWIGKGYIVVDGKLYSERRVLVKYIEEGEK